MKGIHKEHFIGDSQELTIQNEEHNIALDIIQQEVRHFILKFQGARNRGVVCAYMCGFRTWELK